jgi:hypothetical protein
LFKGVAARQVDIQCEYSDMHGHHYTEGGGKNVDKS